MSVASEHVGLFMCLGAAFGGITLSRGIEVAVVRAAHGAPMLASLRASLTATQDALGSLSGPVLLLTGQPHALGAAALTRGPLRCSVYHESLRIPLQLGDPCFPIVPAVVRAWPVKPSSATTAHCPILPGSAWLPPASWLAATGKLPPAGRMNLVHPWNRKNGSPARDCGQTSSRPPLPTRGGFTFEL